MNVRYRKTCIKKNNNNKCTLLECQYTKQESANWGHFFYVSFWRRDRHFTWSSEPREGVAACCAKEVPSSFLSYFKTLSNGPAPGIELATYRSAVMRSTDWANPSAVKPTRTPQGNFSFHIFSKKTCHIKGFWPKLKRMNYTCKKCLELLTLWTSPLERVGIWKKGVLVFFSLPTPVPRVCYKLWSCENGSGAAVKAVQ